MSCGRHVICIPPLQSERGRRVRQGRPHCRWAGDYIRAAGRESNRYSVLCPAIETYPRRRTPINRHHRVAVYLQRTPTLRNRPRPRVNARRFLRIADGLLINHRPDFCKYFRYLIYFPFLRAEGNLKYAPSRVGEQIFFFF